MPYGKAIELFLVNGSPDSIVTAELSNWNGKAIKIPRIDVPNCGREDITQAGVYFLFCKGDDGTEAVYIGEAENVKDRLVQHIRDYQAEKEAYYWSTAVIFIGRDLNKALIRYLETEESFPCAFVQEKEIFMNYKDETVEEIFNMLNFPEPPIRPLSEMKGKTVYQLVSFFTAEQEKKIMSILSHCESTRWNPLFTDVVPAGSSKRIGIDKMLEYFKIPLKECMAFGDGGNDIAMLQHAGIGVAMGNADDDVKQ